jgi:hypothetical protein
MAWSVPKIWEGGECWILGGGPSLPRQFDVPENIIQDVIDKKLPLDAYSSYMSAIHDKHVIGVNTAFMIGNWIDIVFWGDKKWYLNNRQSLGEFPGLKITCHPYFANGQYAKENVKCVVKDNQRPTGISSNPSTTSWNSNSGAAAISIAANMGAKQIVLAGFDMKLGEDKRQHWHAEYGTASRDRANVDHRKLPFGRHLIGFAQIAKDAKRRGITIINVCPDSAIKEFPKMTVKQALDGNIKRIVDGFIVPNPVEPGKRFDWLTEVVGKRGYKLGAEIGTAKGKTAGMVLARHPSLHLYLVDLWEPVPSEVGGGRQYKNWNFPKIKQAFHRNVGHFKDRTTILKGISWEMANAVEDNSLDFVFIDADHEYESVIKDIRAWTPKVKPGGMVSGHDTHFEGVMKALKELIPNFKAVGVDHCWEAKKEDVKL